MGNENLPALVEPLANILFGSVFVDCSCLNRPAHHEMQHTHQRPVGLDLREVFIHRFGILQGHMGRSHGEYCITLHHFFDLLAILIFLSFKS